VPPAYYPLFPGNDQLTTLYFNLFGANIGYAHTFVAKRNPKFFLSLAFVPGISYQHASAYYSNLAQPNRKSDLGMHAEGRICYGYNGDNWYVALAVSGYALAGRIDNVNPFSQGFSFGRLAVGVRLKQPERKIEWLKQIK
jgi:hypothetical protein